MIDDGQEDRGHRGMLFSEDFKICGIASALHRTMGSVICIVYAGGFTKKGDPNPIDSKLEEIRLL